jgi:hypothetical protein
MSGDYTDGALDIVLDVPLMFLATSFKPSCFLTSAELYRCLKSSSVFFLHDRRLWAIKKTINLLLDSCKVALCLKCRNVPL